MISRPIGKSEVRFWEGAAANRGPQVGRSLVISLRSGLIPAHPWWVQP